MKENIQSVKDAGADTVISSCPACDMMWRHVYPEWAKKLGVEYEITARHYSEVIAEKIMRGAALPSLGQWAILAVTFYIPTAPLVGFVLLVVHVAQVRRAKTWETYVPPEQEEIP